MEEKKEISQQIDNNIDRIKEILKRQGLLKMKFPEMFNNNIDTPESIKSEYIALSTLIDFLKNSPIKTWGPTHSSDGYEIDKSVKEQYEEKLKIANENKEKNRRYITLEEEEKFQLPEANIQELHEKVNNVSDWKDCQNVYQELFELQQYQPEDVQYKIMQLIKELALKSKDFSRDNGEEER